MKIALMGMLGFFVAACNVAYGQAKFYITAPKSVPVNQNFQVNVVLENANGSGLKAPSFNDFQLLSGPNTSTSMQWVNGNVTQSVTYSYILQPKQEGTFKIGKASIVVSGVTMESNELTVEVTKAAAQQQTQRRQRNPFDPFDDPFFHQDEDENQPQVSKADIEKQLKEDVFAKLILSRSAVYNGEMVTATYRLYFRRNLDQVGVTKAPAFDGFWSQEVDLDPKRRPTVETVNGRQYHVIDILKYNLYPQRSGNMPVAAAEISTVVEVQTQQPSFFNPFGRSEQLQMKVNSGEAALNVKDLPLSGRPDDFSGAVGQFSFQTSVSSQNGKTDDPITYTVKISGTGNLKLIDAPKLTMPPAFEVYDPKEKENISNSASGLTGSKQYDYLLIPRQPGDYKIDKHSFSYFDPNAGKYITITSPEYALKITGEPSKNLNLGGNATVSRQDVNPLGQDIRYIKTNVPRFKKQGGEFFASVGYYAFYTTPFLLFVGLIAMRRRNENLAADVVGAKRRRALKLARRRLSIADKHLKANDKKQFYDEVSRAMWGYLGDKLSIDMAMLSKDNVEEKLTAHAVKAETVTNLKNLINTCELALYAPVGEHGEMKKNYDLALNLIADLEDEIKK